MNRFAHALLAVVACCVGATSCRKTPTDAQPERRPSVLLILVDTLRTDKLGCYGSPQGLTPFMDRLASEGVRFEHAFAHAPWTLPSAASLYTSTPPTVHGAGGRVNEFRKLPDSARTLAECFRDAGYATGAVVNVDFLTGPFGMDQGFAAEDFDFFAPPDNLTMRRAGPTTDAALKWIGAQRDRPFFCVVHYFDPHLVYDPPPEFRRRFADPRDQDAGGWVFGTREDVVHLRGGHEPPEPDVIRRAEKLYDGEVAYTDSEIGQLLGELAELGLADSTLVVLTADHGEEFLDHGGFEHGHTLYDELVRVPLMVRWPGRIAPAVSPVTVRQIDIAPTLCNLAGVPPDAQFHGRDLGELFAAAKSGAKSTDRPVLSHGNFWGLPLFGWRAQGYQLIQGPQRLELYQVEIDPSQRNDLASKETERARQMLADMQLAMKAAAARAKMPLRKDEPPPTLSPEEERRLRALGY